MNDIDTLLNRYFEGSTTTEEERILKKYFGSDMVAPQHEMYRPLFSLFEKEKQTIIAPFFAVPEEAQKRERITSHRLWFASASVAAVILLGIVIFPFISESDTDPDYLVIVNGSRIADPQKAKEYAEKMFTQACEIKKEQVHSLQEAKEMIEMYNAEKITGEAKKGHYLNTTLNQ